MKHLFNYNENTTFNIEVESIIDKIKDLPIIEDYRKCDKPFLNYEQDDEEYGRRLMKHSILNAIDKDYRKPIIYKIDHKKRTKPTDTPDTIHNYVGKQLIKKLNWNPREDAIFVHNGNLESDDGGDYREYNKIILPIGDYKITWSDIADDFYAVLWNKYHIMHTQQWKKYWNKFPSVDNKNDGSWQRPDNVLKEVDDIYDYLDLYAKSFKEGDFCEWLGKRVEGMLKADSYYFIDEQYTYQIEKFIWGKD